MGVKNNSFPADPILPCECERGLGWAGLETSSFRRSKGDGGGEGGGGVSEVVAHYVGHVVECKGAESVSGEK